MLGEVVRIAPRDTWSGEVVRVGPREEQGDGKDWKLSWYWCNLPRICVKTLHCLGLSKVRGGSEDGTKR